jgi:hypothetical protein
MGVQALSPSTQPLRAICVKLRARAQHEAHPTTRPKYRYRGLGGAPKSPKESSAASKGRETSPAAQWVCSKSFPPWTRGCRFSDIQYVGSSSPRAERFVWSAYSTSSA